MNKYSIYSILDELNEQDTVDTIEMYIDSSIELLNCLYWFNELLPLYLKAFSKEEVGNYIKSVMYFYINIFRKEEVNHHNNYDLQTIFRNFNILHLPMFKRIYFFDEILKIYLEKVKNG